MILNTGICLICFMIVKDPVDCRECGASLCLLCAEAAKSQGKPCPKKCSGDEKLDFKKVNRHVMLMLS